MRTPVFKSWPAFRALVEALQESLEPRFEAKFGCLAMLRQAQLEGLRAQWGTKCLVPTRVSLAGKPILFPWRKELFSSRTVVCCPLMVFKEKGYVVNRLQCSLANNTLSNLRTCTFAVAGSSGPPAPSPSPRDWAEVKKCEFSQISQKPVPCNVGVSCLGRF